MIWIKCWKNKSTVVKCTYFTKMKKLRFYPYAELNEATIIGNEIFNVEKFSKDKAVFPENIFKIKFEYFGFLPYNDCFREVNDFDKLIDFLKGGNYKSFIVGCPPIYLIDSVEINSGCAFKSYSEIITFSNDACENDFF